MSLSIKIPILLLLMNGILYFTDIGFYVKIKRQARCNLPEGIFYLPVLKGLRNYTSNDDLQTMFNYRFGEHFLRK